MAGLNVLASPVAKCIFPVVGNGIIYFKKESSPFDIYTYDISNDTWSGVLSSPPANYTVPFIHGDKLYASKGNSPYGPIWAYDITNNTWNTGLASNNIRRADTAGGYFEQGLLYDGKAYFKKYNLSFSTDHAVLRYNIATNQWSTLANPSMFWETGAIVGSKIYGRVSTNSYIVNRTIVYDIPSNTWQTTGLADPLYQYGASVGYDGKVFALGRVRAGEIHVYDVALNAWSIMHTDRIFCSGIVAYEGKLYTTRNSVPYNILSFTIPTSNLTGSVNASDGTVRVFDVERNLVAEGRINPNGTYKVLVDAGTYTVEGSDGESTCMVVNNVHINGDTNLNLTLQPVVTQISTAQEFYNIRFNPSGNYTIVKDIDMASIVNSEPIGGFLPPHYPSFTGKIKSKGNEIYNIKNVTVDMTRLKNGSSILGYCTDIELEGLIFENPTIIGEDDVGIIASSAYKEFGTPKIKKVGVLGGTVSGNSYVSGFIYDIYEVNPEQCFVKDITIIISNYGYAAALFCNYTGGNTIINDCYATGTVHLGVDCEEVAGFCNFHRNDSKLNNCYSVMGIVGTPTGLEGLVNWKNSSATILSSYYDSEVLGQVAGEGTPKTTAQMKQKATFSGWDFKDIWGIKSTINDGYPYLLWVYLPDEFIPNYPPQSYIELSFTAGDSDPYPMGRFFIDRTQFAVGRETVSIQGRNSIGKYLKDQSFDERNYYPEAALKTQFERALLAAGITNYHVAVNNTPVGMEFPPNMDMLTGIQELLKLTPGWIIREDVGGKVVVGPRNDANFTQPSKYTFYRNRDIFSRESIRDDNDAYGRVCCHTADYSVRVYRPVPSALGWLPPAQKTFYVPVPDGTRSAEAASLAVELAEQMANSGEVETFVGPYRPHLIPGDQAEIIDADGPNLLGVITTVEHSWSKGGQGFITGITVDSGGKIGKPQLREFIDALAARQRSGAVKL